MSTRACARRREEKKTDKKRRRGWKEGRKKKKKKTERQKERKKKKRRRRRRRKKKKSAANTTKLAIRLCRKYTRHISIRGSTTHCRSTFERDKALLVVVRAEEVVVAKHVQLHGHVVYRVDVHVIRVGLHMGAGDERRDVGR